MSSVDSGDALDGDRVALLAALADRIDHEFADITQLEIAFRHRSWCAKGGRVERALGVPRECGAAARRTSLHTVHGGRTSRPASCGAEPALAGAAVSTSRLLLGVARRDGRCRGHADCEAVISNYRRQALGRSVGGRLLGPEIAHVESGAVRATKSRLQEFAAHRLERMPRYSVVGGAH
jgi:hypothetical protein